MLAIKRRQNINIYSLISLKYGQAEVMLPTIHRNMTKTYKKISPGVYEGTEEFTTTDIVEMVDLEKQIQRKEEEILKRKESYKEEIRELEEDLKRDNDLKEHLESLS